MIKKQREKQNVLGEGPAIKVYKNDDSLLQNITKTVLNREKTKYIQS